MPAPHRPFPGDVSDDDLARRTTAFLASRGFHSFRNLRVSAESGVVRISGQLRSWHEKQVAQESCQRVAGVRQVIDSTEVASPALTDRPAGSLVRVA